MNYVNPDRRQKWPAWAADQSTRTNVMRCNSAGWGNAASYSARFTMVIFGTDVLTIIQTGQFFTNEVS